MPLSYRIDRERGLVITEASGILTDAHVLTHKARLAKDPDFDPGMAEISDIRQIERLDVTPEGVRAMVQHDAANAARRTGHRMALVVPSDVGYGMARMYQLMGSGDPGVGVFRTMEEAVAWLLRSLA